MVALMDSGPGWCIRCTDPVWNLGFERGNLVAWN
jgi:hypothetical protein